MANVLDKIGIPENIKIEAFDEDGKSIGVFESINNAARKLFIRNNNSIGIYLNGTNGSKFTRAKRGVKSYKTGKLYHFKKVTNE